ncbi:Phytochrome-like protein cph2 [Gimesia alba]|uniref:diguanylate cyclase n=1 Tax=Gimesia alba TaxID=2527973 RepID=A0A517RMV7_9PLAN|nr:sensor domain-containing diguanylate cyclase [Gimesia alba]QDT45206.1 Phytochrome-like protein cph2 [Gimesia alba]
MCDSRIKEYETVIEKMSEGYFPRKLSGEMPVDDLGRLGMALLELSKKLEKKFDEMQKLSEVTTHINEGLFLDEILDQLYDSFRNIIPYERIGLAMLEEGESVLRAHWERSEAKQVYLKGGFKALMAGSSLQQILETGNPRIINNLKKYLLEHPCSASTKLIVKEGIRSSLTCPLVVQGKPIGFIFFSSFLTNAYRETHISIFKQIANQLASIIEKGKVYEELYQLNLKLQRANARLEDLATYDDLTGVCNRRIFNEMLHKEWFRAIRHSTVISLIMIDVDYFKNYNDSYGHVAGDFCLNKIAETITRIIKRPGDLIARYGGEEFVVLLPETEIRAAQSIAEQIRLGIENLGIEHRESLNADVVTISAGLTTMKPQNDNDPLQIISEADDALYKAKYGGRNRVVTLSGELISL